MVEINFPLEKYWETEKVLNELNYMIASGEATTEVVNTTKKLFLTCAPFASLEKDRIWLYEKAKE